MDENGFIGLFRPLFFGSLIKVKYITTGVQKSRRINQVREGKKGWNFGGKKSTTTNKIIFWFCSSFL